MPRMRGRTLNIQANAESARMPLNSDATSQFKITAKRRPNRAVYLKLSIQFCKISNYGTASSFGGGVDGALERIQSILELAIRNKNNICCDKSTASEDDYGI